MKDDREKKLAFIQGLASDQAPVAQIVGALDPIGDANPVIVIIDDKSSVVRGFQRELETSSQRPVRFALFRITNSAGGTRQELLEWLETLDRIDAVFVDGDLTAEGSGLDVVRLMRERDAWKYLPIAILTADESFINRHRRIDDRVRIMPKFEEPNRTLDRLSLEYMDVVSEARGHFWTDLQFLVARSIQQGESLLSVVAKAGQQLVEHLGVCGWYLRVKEREEMAAIDYLDYFNAGRVMPMTEVPEFQRKLLEEQVDEPWIYIERLDESQCDTKTHMLGYGCISAHVGGARSTRNALFSAYVAPTAEVKLSERDARELHHLGMQIRALLEVEESKAKLSDLAEVLKRILAAGSSVEIATELRDFVHHSVNSYAPIFQKTKTNVRMFDRGSAKLIRRGSETEAYSAQSLETGLYIEGIDVNDVRSSHARVARSMASELCRNLLEEDFEVLTSAPNVRAFLTVPVAIDQGCLGAINLESTQCGLYTRTDQVLVEAVSEVAAIAIYTLRSQRFVSRLTELAERAVDPHSTHDASPEGILEDAALAVFDMAGFSNMILLEPEKGASESGPWKVVAGWRSGPNGAEPDNKRRVQHWTEILEDNWSDTFIVKALNSPQSNKVLFSNNPLEILRDHDDQGIRPGQPTLSQLVVRIGDNGSHDRLLSILFEQPNPLPRSFFPVLESFANFLTSVYSASADEIAEYAFKLFRSRSEARILRQFGDMRHTVIGKLHGMASDIEADIDEGLDPSVIIKRIISEIQSAEELILGTRYVESEPKIEEISVGDVWNSMVGILAKSKVEGQPRVERTNCEAIINFDDSFLKSVFFHLIDNAVHHSRGASKVSLRKYDQGFLVIDDGAPISHDVKGEMFKLGYSTSSTGSGQGLYIARARMLELGGDLRYQHLNGENQFMVEVTELDAEP